MFTVSVSVSGPPVPVLPRSLEVMVNPPKPVKPAAGVNVMPFRAALTFTSVPRKVIVASAVPSPAPVPFASVKLKLKPLVPLSVSVPLLAVSVTWIVLPPASTSATEMALPPEKTSAVFCGVPCEPGTVFTGASLTAVIAIPRVAEPVFVPSSAVKVTVRVAVDGLSLLFA